MAYNKQMIKLNEEKQRRLKEKNERLNIDEVSPVKDKVIIMTIALLLGVCFDTFLIGQYWGISVGIIALIFISGVHFSVKEKHFNGMSYLFLGAILLLSGTFAIYNNFTLRFLNVLLLPIVFTAYTLSIRYPDWKYMNVTYLLKIGGKMYPKSIGTIPKLFAFIHGFIKEKPRKEMSDSTKHVLGGLIVGIPILAITIVLLSSADAVFSNYLSELTDFIELPRLDKFIEHLIPITFVTLYAFGYLWSNQYDDLKYQKEVHVKKMVEPLTMVTIMGLLVLVYIAFTAIQFSYLYIGMGHLPNGLTYAEYARKGFFELIFVTVMNMSIVLFGVLVTKNENVKLDQLLKSVYTIMIVFTFNLLVSSFYRMSLYEKAYGYTELRLFVQFFIVFLAISIISLMVWIWKREIPLFKVGVVTAIAVYLVLNFINVDKIIASKNFEHYVLTGHLDRSYITTLSADAYEVIEREKELLGQENYNNYVYYNKISSETNNWYEYNYFKSLMKE